ncbi:acyltransferase [Dyadobacter flavalbus]|uniref:Acyltransferase n=1 Tax=Dyadobacter flavalbus TaxID=2579942 RepID=A0A5M8QRE9_9BACT|nr:acyltransferase [Dyadobacter flavalbus]KAA6436762.1 acyltransferase [Dyadobacter flavalbus]
MDLIRKLTGYINIIIYQLQYKYLFSGSIVIVKPGSSCYIERNVKIVNSKITVCSGSTLEIKKNTKINKAVLYVEGKLTVEPDCIIENGDSPGKATILIYNGGLLEIDNNTRLRCKIWIRYGGKVKIGKYTNINEGTEIRSDDQIHIGDFCMISYNCVIWDTNTHNIYPDEERRKLTVNYYPKFGHEIEKPKTAKIYIGNDCWIGREAVILKGVTIKNSVVVGYRTMLSKGIIEDNKTVIQDISYRVLDK